MSAILTTKQVEEMVMGALIDKFGKEINQSYSSPIIPIIKEVIDENREKIKTVFQEALDTSFNDKEFQKIVREEFKHKVAKQMVGSLEGEVEKAVNAIRQDQTLKARMILAIEKMIK